MALSEAGQNASTQRMNNSSVERLMAKVTDATPDSNYYLAIAYANGYGRFEKDMKEAKKALEKGVKLGSLYAKVGLGELLVTGSFSFSFPPLPQHERDTTRGIALLKEAAVESCVYSEVHVGLHYSQELKSIPMYISRLYAYGMFIEKDIQQSELWRIRAYVDCNAKLDYGWDDQHNRPRDIRPEEYRQWAIWALLSEDKKMLNFLFSDTGGRLINQDMEDAKRLAEVYRLKAVRMRSDYPVPPNIPVYRVP